MEITNINQLDFSKTYSFADYITWKFSETVELLRGKIVAMAAPKPMHQDVVIALGSTFRAYLRHQKCRAYVAPFDVKLYNRAKSIIADRDIYTVVQPDVCIVCDLELVRGNKACNGAPDLVVEVVSQSTQDRDLHEKKDLYAEAGVREYWIVFTESKLVLTHFLNENGTYNNPHVYTDTDHVTPYIFPDLSVDLSDVFDFPEEY
jgi:Uma2 family endonuclease